MHVAKSKTTSYLSELQHLATLTGKDYGEVLMMTQSIAAVTPASQVKEKLPDTEATSPQPQPPQCPAQEVRDANHRVSRHNHHHICWPSSWIFIPLRFSAMSWSILLKMRTLLTLQISKPGGLEFIGNWRIQLCLISSLDSLLPPTADIMKHLSPDTLPTVNLETLDSWHTPQCKMAMNCLLNSRTPSRTLEKNHLLNVPSSTPSHAELCIAGQLKVFYSILLYSTLFSSTPLPIIHGEIQSSTSIELSWVCLEQMAGVCETTVQRMRSQDSFLTNSCWISTTASWLSFWLPSSRTSICLWLSMSGTSGLVLRRATGNALKSLRQESNTLQSGGRGYSPLDLLCHSDISWHVCSYRSIF